MTCPARHFCNEAARHQAAHLLCDRSALPYFTIFARPVLSGHGIFCALETAATLIQAVRCRLLPLNAVDSDFWARPESASAVRALFPAPDKWAQGMATRWPLLLRPVLRSRTRVLGLSGLKRPVSPVSAVFGWLDLALATHKRVQSRRRARRRLKFKASSSVPAAPARMMAVVPVRPTAQPASATPQDWPM